MRGLSTARGTVRMAGVIREEAGVLSKAHQHRAGGANIGLFQGEGAALTHSAWEPGIRNSVFMTSSFGACCQRGFHLC